MAKKKPRPEGDKPKRRGRVKGPVDMPVLPDRRVMEGQMWQEVRSLLGAAPDGTSPQGQAEALLRQAFAEQAEKRRVQLAKEALALWPDCADAYVLLAEHTPRRKDALALYEKGVAAGERALGVEAFQQHEGHFWSMLETRPYMRARMGLAEVLWTTARREEAVQHLQDMLRLNPGDNQGARYTLAGFLLFLDRDDDLERLLAQYADEDSATWAYTRALLAFRKQGDTLDARRLLKTAKKANKHVPAYLLGQKFPSPRQPDYYSPGDETEALNYIGSFLAAWKSTPGAVAWLRDNMKSSKRKEAAPEPKGPLGFIKTWLKNHLPQQDDVWQAGFRQTPNWIVIGGERVRPWMILVTSQSNDYVLAHNLADDEPIPALLWDTLVRAMQHPAMGDPHRPSELQVLPGERLESLRPHFEEIGVRLVVADELDQLDGVLTGLTEQIGGEAEPGLLDAPGLTPHLVGGFFDAAAIFFQQAPWKKVGYESAIRVECDKFQGGPWYAVLMGQSGLTMGLALYDDLETLRRLWEGDMGDEENAEQTVAMSVTFGEESEIPVADLEAAKRHAWKVARPDAYPSVFRKERGMNIRPPLAWELELMEGCLRATPDFVNRRRQDDATKEEVTVPTAAGELKLGLSWVVDLEEGK
jgi:tetratricopeptide (TPR) repeat protein